MAKMYITEYSHAPTTQEGLPIQAGQEPAVTTQVITYTTTAVSSAAFSAGVNFVRITLDTTGHVLFGTSPTAVTLTHTPMQADTPEFFGVAAGKKVSAVV